MLTYTHDYDEQFPLAAYARSATEFVTWHDLADPYVHNQAIWYCPSSSVQKTDASGKATAHFGYHAGYLTTIAPDFSNANGHTSCSPAAIEQPAETVMLSDAQASIAGSWCGDDGKFLLAPSQPDTHCWGRPNSLHDGGSNLFWIDGHTRWLRPEQFYTNQTPPDRFFDRQ